MEISHLLTEMFNNFLTEENKSSYYKMISSINYEQEETNKKGEYATFVTTIRKYDKKVKSSIELKNMLNNFSSLNNNFEDMTDNNKYNQNKDLTNFSN